MARRWRRRSAPLGVELHAGSVSRRNEGYNPATIRRHNNFIFFVHALGSCCVVYPITTSGYNPRRREPMLSETALSLLSLHLSGERVEVTDETRDAYRELAKAGLMIPLHTFTGGNESAYRLTEAAVSFFASRRALSAEAPAPRR
jgi:hypothetical protein